MRYLLEITAKQVCISSNVAPKPRLGKLGFWLEILVKKLSSALSIFQKTRFIKFWKNELFQSFSKMTGKSALLLDGRLARGHL